MKSQRLQKEKRIPFSQEGTKCPCCLNETSEKEKREEKEKKERRKKKKREEKRVESRQLNPFPF